MDDLLRYQQDKQRKIDDAQNALIADLARRVAALEPKPETLPDRTRKPRAADPHLGAA